MNTRQYNVLAFSITLSASAAYLMAAGCSNYNFNGPQVLLHHQSIMLKTYKYWAVLRARV